MDRRLEPVTPGEQAIAQVIAHHYGDGGVYVPRDLERFDAMQQAIANGFLSEEGFVTRKGRRLLARTAV
jgi:hypothetical protein